MAPKDNEILKGLDSPSNTRGPLDSLIDSELDAGGADSGLGSSLSAAPSSRKFKYRLRAFFRNIVKRYQSKTVRVQEADPRKVWLLLFSWGFAVLLIAGGIFTFWWLSPRSSDDIFSAITTAEANQNFADAIAQCDYYLKNYPQSEKAGEVTVRRGLETVRQASKEAAASGDWTKAYDAATKFVDENKKNHAFAEMLGVTGGFVADVGVGLAHQAEQHPTKDVVDKAKRIRYVLQMDWQEVNRPGPKIDEIDHTLEPAEHSVERENDQKATLAAVSEAIDHGDMNAAYLARNQAVERFPELIDSSELAKAFEQASSTLGKKVRYVEKNQAALTDERASSVAGSLPLVVQPVQGEMAEAKGQPIFVAASGAVFGLDAGTGQVLWRRSLPQDPSRIIPPLTLSHETDGDVILTDTVNNELLRIEAKTGRVIWRQTLAAPLVSGPIVTGPVRHGNQLLVITKDQKLVMVDLVRGNVRGVVELPQAFHLPPVVDADHGYVILTADNANLYVLVGTNCRQVLHLGQEKGAIATPPLVVGSTLLVAVNGKKQDATLELLAINDLGSNDRPADAKTDTSVAIKLLTRLKIRGHVEAPLQNVGHGALVVTADGGMQQYKINPKGETPLELVDKREPFGDLMTARWPMVYHRRVWVADTQLAQYDAPDDHGHIVPNAVTDSGSVFTTAPVIIPGGMFHVRQRRGMPGVIVSAVDLVHQVPKWQTWLGAPLAGEPISESGGKLIAFTASGGMFRFKPDDLQGLKAGPQATVSVEAASLAQPIRDITPLSQGMIALTSGSGTRPITLFDPQDEHRLRTMRAPNDMARAPAAFYGGLLIPCTNGSVYLSDYRKFTALAEALPPPLEGLSNWAWQRPCPCGDKSVLLCDGDKRLFLVRVAAPPASQSATEPDKGQQLKAVKEATLAKEVAAPVAVLTNNAYVVDATGTVLAYSLADFTPSPRGNIQGKCEWGPRRAGNLILLATDSQLLYAYDEDHEVWHVPLRYAPPVGEPLVVGDTIALASSDGTVWRLAAGDGTEASHLDAGCRLTTGPIEAAGHLFVGTRDGSVLQLR